MPNNFQRRRTVNPLDCRSLEAFCSLLSDKLQWFANLQNPWRSGFLCGARIHSLHLLNSSRNCNICWHIPTAHFVLADKYSPGTACFVYHLLHWNSLWVEISTLGYEMNTLLTRKVVSGLLYPYNSDKSNAQKLEISTKSMFTATLWPSDGPLVVLG